MPLQTPEEVLRMYLGPEYIKYKNTGYTKEPYIEGWAAINIANEIFGHNGWSSEIKMCSINDIKEVETQGQPYTVTVSATVRITLKDGAYREDIGFGISENQKHKALAIKHAHKSAITDAIKRALRQFGRVLGNCCYDSHYRESIRKMRCEPRKPIPETQFLRPEEYRRMEELPEKDISDQNNERKRKKPADSNSLPNLNDIISSDF